MIDPVTNSLFFYYPRTAHIPQIYRLGSDRDFERYIRVYNGTKTGCHVSLYDVSRRPVIDKILFEFDASKAKLHLVLEEVSDLVEQFKKSKLPYIPVFSGGKGFHVYLILKPVEIDSEIAKAVIRQVQYKFASDGSDGSKIIYTFLDRQKIGVVRTQIRVPNTLNGSLFCTYLPQHFNELSISEIIELASRPRCYVYDCETNKSVLDIADYHVEINTISCDPPVIEAPTVPRLCDLVDIIRPCVYREIVENKNPPHAVRLTFVSELMWLGHTQEQIYNLCKQIGWSDFNSNKTRYHIDYIFKCRLFPYSCRKLREFVKCSNCGWIYDWGCFNEGNSCNGISREKFSEHCDVDKN